jgi:hypothetical protein
VYNVDDDPVSLLFLDLSYSLNCSRRHTLYWNVLSAARAKGLNSSFDLLPCHRPLLRWLPTPVLRCELFLRVYGHLT